MVLVAVGGVVALGFEDRREGGVGGEVGAGFADRFELAVELGGSGAVAICGARTADAFAIVETEAEWADQSTRRRVRARSRARATGWRKGVSNDWGVAGMKAR